MYDLLKVIGVFSTIVVTSTRSDQKQEEDGTLKVDVKGSLVCLEGKSEYAADGRIDFLLTFTNKSPDKVILTEIDGIRELRILLRSGDGSLAAVTERGRYSVNILDPDNLRAPGAKNASESVAPGATYTWHIPVSDLFILKPGTYGLSVSPELDFHDSKVKVEIINRIFKVTSH